MKRIISVLAVASVMVAMVATPGFAVVAPQAPEANCVGELIGRTATGFNTGSEPVNLPPGAGGQMVSGVAEGLGPGQHGFSLGASSDCGQR